MWVWVSGLMLLDAQPPDASTACVIVSNGSEVVDGMHVCDIETTDFEDLVFQQNLRDVRIDGISGNGFSADVRFLGTLERCAIGKIELNGAESVMLFLDNVMSTTIDSITGNAESTYIVTSL
uniref:Uncharacterized protein n=1 Tax=Compsopogon caeruleus TaxID=31354 RepID=A0A6T6BME7_9RHOD